MRQVIKLAIILVSCAAFTHIQGQNRKVLSPDTDSMVKEKSSVKITRGKLKANGITIAFESFGSKKRETILLIMGTGEQLIAYPVELCEELVKRGYRVIRYDNRDVGLSTKFDAVGKPDYAAIERALKAGQTPPLPYTINDMAKDAVGLLDALGIKKAHIVGVSMGGAIAQLVAADYPERALSLTSISASSGNPDLPKPKPEVFGALLAPVPAAGDWEAIAAYRIKIGKAIGSPGYPIDEKTLREKALQAAKRSWYPAGAERQAAAAFVADLGGVNDRRSKLKTIKAPTVVVHGGDDPLVPVEAGRDVAANIPGSELRIIPGLGHDFPVAIVGKIADAITSAASRAGKS